MKFYAYTIAAGFKTLVYWLPTITHLRTWILFPFISVHVLKAHYKRFLITFSLFLHFDFCSTHYKSVLKINSFSLLKQKEEEVLEKLVQYAVKIGIKILCGVKSFTEILPDLL